VRAGAGVTVFERTPAAGGRMATRYFDGRPADIDASYFTTRDERFAAVAHRWRAKGLAREWTDTLRVLESGRSAGTTGPMRWASPGGLQGSRRRGRRDHLIESGSGPGEFNKISDRSQFLTVPRADRPGRGDGPLGGWFTLGGVALQ
jgi:hypothetical protein